MGSSRWRGILTIATVLIGVAVGYGAWRAVELAVSPTPTPRPSPTPYAAPSLTGQPSPTAMTTYTYRDAGYSITLSDDWELWDPGSFHNPAKPEVTLSILSGTPDGHLSTCTHGPLSIFGPTPSSGPPCAELVFGSAADLAAIVQRTAAMGQTTAAIGTLQLAGDEVTLYRRFTFDGYEYVLVDLHDGRPFVLHLTFTYVVDAFWVDAQQATRLIQDAISRFVFLP